MGDRLAIQDRYPEDVAHCFGCGRLNGQGHQIKSFVEGEEVVARFRPSGEQVSLPGFVYGGLIASLVDCHSMATAAAAFERERGADPDGAVPRFVTAALTVEYLRPTPAGVELELRARAVEVGERKVVVEAVVTAGGEPTARGRTVAVRMPASMAGRVPGATGAP